MTTYTLSQANSWFNIEALFNIGAIFGIYSGDPRPISPEPSTEEIKNPLEEVLNPSKKHKKKPIGSDTDSSSNSTIDSDSQV
ncbi:hypothetical protein [Nostoc sp. MS1]|uniref:hypothetical protein n=1 Tax=Nostoc sp. MS1 TaxID=2764711 RepID=UPI001CC7D54E|nr:hypothetical protein [Nostoc sp. MS1]BCL37094.1 hypothetical protein NSMS1_35410 [Nostoc sp. MS1]